MNEARVVLAVLKRNLRLLARHPFNMAGLVLMPLYQTLLPSLLLGASFLVSGRAVGLGRLVGTTDLAGFLFAGAFVGSLIGGTFLGTWVSLSSDINTGTLVTSWLTPARRSAIALGDALAGLLISGTAGLILLALGELAFGAHYAASAVLALPALLICLVGLAGLAHLVAALVLRVREAGAVVDVASYLVVAASCVLFPLAALPGVVQPAALALPTTYALDVLRVNALGTRPDLPPGWEYAGLAGTTVAMVVLGRLAFAWTERWLRRSGSIGLH